MNSDFDFLVATWFHDVLRSFKDGNTSKTVKEHIMPYLRVSQLNSNFLSFQIAYSRHFVDK